MDAIRAERRIGERDPGPARTKRSLRKWRKRRAAAAAEDSDSDCGPRGLRIAGANATAATRAEAAGCADLDLVKFGEDDMDKRRRTRQLGRIARSGRTSFEKRVWTLLCEVPRGRFTTYGVMAAQLQSSPRAVGNALRRNPFAPEVPCHRVVATGNTLGGFKGERPPNGEGITLDEKRALLRGEGVRFDPTGARVLGSPYMFTRL